MFGVRHRKRGDGGQEVNLSMMVTPMLDMTFQLLAFFIITFKPTPLEGQMSLLLAAEKTTGGQNLNQPVETEPVKPKVDLTAIVASEGGGIDGIQVRNGNQTAEVKGGVEGLHTYLTNLRKEVPELSSQEEITIEASSKLEYSNLIYLMDVCMKTGFKKPAFGLPPDLQGQQGGQ
jgi:biopolymer transport protein ExbD